MKRNSRWHERFDVSRKNLYINGAKDYETFTAKVVDLSEGGMKIEFDQDVEKRFNRFDLIYFALKICDTLIKGSAQVCWVRGRRVGLLFAELKNQEELKKILVSLKAEKEFFDLLARKDLEKYEKENFFCRQLKSLREQQLQQQRETKKLSNS